MATGARPAAHAVEVYNHGFAVENDRSDGFYLLDALCNEGRKLTAIATDDANFRNGDHDAFGGFVEVKAESADPETLIQSLKEGHFYATQWPRIFDVDASRREVTVACSPVNAISLLTGTSRAISRIGRQLTNATLKLETTTKKTRPDFGPLAWFRVVVIAAAGRS